MSRILILFASSHGATQTIAMTIGSRLRRVGHEVDAIDIHEHAPSPAGYDAVLLGSRVEFGRHDRALARYVRRHRDALAQRPTGFFSVSMSAADGGDSAQAHQYLDGFFGTTRWRPPIAAALAGGLPYTRYGWLLRLVMKSISRGAGHSIDTTRDHVYTDWDAVDRFTDTFALSLAPQLTPHDQPHASA